MKESTEVGPSTETDDKTISDNKSTDTSINNNNKETPGADNTKSDNNPGNTNSANGSSRAVEEITNSNNNITKCDNNNNELMYPVCNNTTTTTSTLSTSSNQIITKTGTGINMHTTTATVDQYLEQQLENDTTEHLINIPETGNSTVDATADALQGKTTPEKIAIESLLNIGDSLEYEDHNLEENALLMPVDRPPAIPIEPKGVIPTEPVNPELTPVPTSDTPPHSKGNDTDTTEILKTGTPDNVIDNQEEPLEVKMTTKKKTKKIKKTVRKNKKKKNTNTPQNDAPGEKKDMKREPKPIKKGKLITQTFVLKRGSRPKRKFYCVIGKCKNTCTTRKELNNHHLTAHPRIVCDICNKLFDTPNCMRRHRYSHKKPKHFCADCGKGFYFESELTSHRRCHLKIPGYSCFAKNCNKSYKREAELRAHVVTHKKKRIDCPVRTCSYFTYDTRNLMQHNRQHMPMKFECVHCYKKFRYFEQKKRHEPKCTSNPVKLTDQK